MNDYSDAMINVALSGATAGVSTTLAASLCGAVESGNAIAPLNAISHIAWGDTAARQADASWQYTAVGVALNVAAVTSWAAVYELLSHQLDGRTNPWRNLGLGAFVSGLAYVTDYYIVPRRLTPGFEKRLSNRSLLAIYSVLAVSLAAHDLSQTES